MNVDAEGKGTLKNIIQACLDKAASSSLIRRCLAIIDESADNKESFRGAASRISKIIRLYIDKDLAQTVYEGLLKTIEKIASPQGTRRRYRRVIFERKIRFKHEGQQQEAESLSLSEGGMFIKTMDLLPVGAEMELTLPLELARRIQLTGAVIYQRQPSSEITRLQSGIGGIGIKFKEVSEEKTEILRYYIRSLPF